MNESIKFPNSKSHFVATPGYPRVVDIQVKLVSGEQSKAQLFSTLQSREECAAKYRNDAFYHYSFGHEKRHWNPKMRVLSCSWHRENADVEFPEEYPELR
jgi:hypothetical protein